MLVTEVRNLLSPSGNNEQYLQHPLPSNNGAITRASIDLIEMTNKM
jgi:hypothetical protein